jgi:hypothetical protein
VFIFEEFLVEIFDWVVFLERPIGGVVLLSIFSDVIMLRSILTKWGRGILNFVGFIRKFTIVIR